MDIITVNVGQGSLAIVRNRSEAIAIDARIPPGGDDTVGNVKRHLATFLKDHAFRGVILTGFDRDHADVRCLAILLRKYRPEWVLFPDYDKDTDSYADVMTLLDEEVELRASTASPLEIIPVTMASLQSIDLSGLANGLVFEIFSPHPEDMTSSNNCSLVVKIRGTDPGGFSYLVTGDTENDRWATINRFFARRLAADVMAAPHHGSRNATNAETLLHVAPNTILISAGVDNPFGHPDPAVVQAYLQVARHVFGTHIDGGCSLHTKRHNGDFRTIAFTD